MQIGLWNNRPILGSISEYKEDLRVRRSDALGRERQIIVGASSEFYERHSMLDSLKFLKLFY